MNDLGLAVMLGLTSLAGYLVGRHRLGLSTAGLRAAAAATLETIGLGVLFLLANLMLMMLPILVSRALGARFVSIYSVEYVTLAAVSLLQGLVFRWWRDRG